MTEMRAEMGERAADKDTGGGGRADSRRWETPLNGDAGTPTGPTEYGDYVELHCASAYSFQRAGSGVEALVARAAALGTERGMRALALTDHMTLAGVVRFQAACAEHGVKGIVGCALAVSEPHFGTGAAGRRPAEVVALAENAVGYARLCALLTAANLRAPEAPVVTWAELAAEPEGLILLTGGPEMGTLARLVRAGRRQEAVAVARRYGEAFGADGGERGRERVFVELQQQRLPESVGLMQGLVEVAEAAGLRVVATNGVRYATRADYAVYDLLACVRLGISVDVAHRERPRNDEAYLKSDAEMRTLFVGLPWGQEALAATGEIAGRCAVALLRGTCTAPAVALGEGETPDERLAALCEAGLWTRYGACSTREDGQRAGQRAAQVAEQLAAEEVPEALRARSAQRRQLAHELDVIGRLELAEFFLCVREMVAAARGMGVRISGRGSAANSLVAYLLGITGVDPIAHGLLFERFLNPERRGMPDIDLDIQSDRREEVIRWVERRYTHAHAAMVANVITYRARLALRDVAKALGYPLDLVNRMTKVLPHHCGRGEIAGYAEELAGVVRGWQGQGRSAAEGGARGHRAGQRDTWNTALGLQRLPLALEMAARVCGLPRHLSLHNGGMVLSRAPLAEVLPVRVSANGVRALEVDKDDVERLGLIKFDLLGLRTLGAVAEALTLIEETTGQRPDVDHLPTEPPDAQTMELIRAGQTLAVFQIESPGQWHLLAQTQPETFTDLIVQTALFRPGPIQGGFVRPYVEQRRGKYLPPQPPSLFGTTQRGCAPLALRGNGEQRAHGAWQWESLQREQERVQRGVEQRDAVQTPWQGGQADTFWTGHAVLGPILRESAGILLFQEQILEIAHQFAGLSYAEADGFRRAMSHAREPEQMAAMRGRFVAGAMARGETAADAERVFGAVSAFVGYGFCKSHAAEFARTIYQTAWLKAHYPAHYLAAFLSAQPAGFFPPHVVLEEAKLLGVPVLPPEVNRSEGRFTVERVGVVGTKYARWGIRIGLAQVKGVGEELARAILWERSRGEQGSGGGQGQGDGERRFRSLAEFCQRMRAHGLTWAAAEALVLAGACSGLHPGEDRRRLLWRLHELWPLVGTMGVRVGAGAQAKKARKKDGKRRRVGEDDGIEQLVFDWPVGGVGEMGDGVGSVGDAGQRDAGGTRSTGGMPGVVGLPGLSREERLALDYTLLGMSAGPHPLALLRRELRRRGVLSIAEVGNVPAGRMVRVAGWAISAQRPPTAHGMGFVVLEDETGRLPVALPPQVASEIHRVLREARVVQVLGRVERVGWYRALLGLRMWGEGGGRG